eukprot:TRINITY_DN5425_c0_g1_i1.p1 TRINITY_DN5425_c0_g1~~TRINITY_DN5425_c0_g1_i1.p1  ORF type:complete len:498 (+),score=116.03 TRINITY_DN5425_c0_g1_i1:74-1567(+)
MNKKDTNQSSLKNQFVPQPGTVPPQLPKSKTELKSNLHYTNLSQKKLPKDVDDTCTYMTDQTLEKSKPLIRSSTPNNTLHKLNPTSSQSSYTHPTKRALPLPKTSPEPPPIKKLRVYISPDLSTKDRNNSTSNNKLNQAKLPEMQKKDECSTQGTGESVRPEIMTTEPLRRNLVKLKIKNAISNTGGSSSDGVSAISSKKDQFYQESVPVPKDIDINDEDNRKPPKLIVRLNCKSSNQKTNNLLETNLINRFEPNQTKGSSGTSSEIGGDGMWQDREAALKDFDDEKKVKANQRETEREKERAGQKNRPNGRGRTVNKLAPAMKKTPQNRKLNTLKTTRQEEDGGSQIVPSQSADKPPKIRLRKPNRPKEQVSPATSKTCGTSTTDQSNTKTNAIRTPSSMMSTPESSTSPSPSRSTPTTPTTPTNLGTGSDLLEMSLRRVYKSLQPGWRRISNGEEEKTPYCPFPPSPSRDPRRDPSYIDWIECDSDLELPRTKFF